MRASELSFTRARSMRRDMSLPELLLWDCLRGGRLKAIRFRRQHPAGSYVLDFYCPTARLAVEVDGAHHDHPAQMHHDARRDGWLAERGIRVMRIAASDILNDRAFEGALLVIAEMAAGADVPDVYAPPSFSNTPPPPPSAVPFPGKRGRIDAGGGRDLGSSPAKRGRGTMRSMVEVARESRRTAEGGGGGGIYLGEGEDS
jgi:very-short-patch-repair endonuclease